MSLPTPIILYSLSSATMLSLLPNGYTPLSYIESTGTLYIDTGWIPNADSKIEVSFEPLDTNTETYYPISCITDSNGRLIFELFIKNKSGIAYSINGGQKLTSGNYSRILNAIITTDKLIMNGITIESGSKPTISNPYSCYLFSYRAGGGSSDSRHMSCKLYSFKGFDSSISVDLRPARRDSDGVLGMYDLVSKTFKTNAGSGTFIAGPELAIGKNGGKSLPEEYQLVEYLESDGSSAFPLIRVSSVPLLANDQLEIETVINRVDNNSLPSIFGEASKAQIYFPNKVLAYWLALYVEAISPASGTTITLGTKYYIKTKIKDTLSSYNFFTYTASNYPAACKIYHAIITRSSSAILNLYPCYRKSDMKPGMYDTVNGVFYTNAGSGEFILGPTVSGYYSYEPNASSKLALNPYDKDMYYESDGSRWMRIFHHNNPAASKFASGVNLSNAVYESADKWSCINLINKDLGNWELMLKQKDTSSSSEVKYRWVQYYNPFTATWALVQPGNVLNRPGYSGTNGGMWKINSDTYFCIANTSSSNWFGAIGCWTTYLSGIPGYPNTTCTTGYMDLYIRVDDNASFLPFASFTNVSCASDNKFGLIADFATNTSHLSTTIPAIGNNFSISWWELSSNYNGGTMPWGIYPFNPLYSKCLNTGDGSSNPWYKPGTTTAIKDIVGNTWHHFVITGNGSANYLYVDGIKIGQSKTFKYPSGTGLVMNGWAMSTDYCRNPKIINFQIFNIALTDAQVKELYCQ